MPDFLRPVFSGPVLCFFSLLPVFSLPLLAADDPVTIVISASRFAQPASEVGSSVTVLDGETLRERGVAFVADALQQVPSLSITRSGSRGSQAQLRLRGNESNHVLVLIDGVRVSDASAGEFDFSRLSMAGIERIEVLSGPQSTLYGSDAAAGVILITTHRGEQHGEQGVTGNISTTLGSFNTNAQAMQLSGAQDGWHFAIAASRHDTDGISSAAESRGNTEKDGYELKNFRFNSGYEHDLFSTRFDYTSDSSMLELDGGGVVATDSLIDNQLRDSESLAWTIKVPLLDGSLQNTLRITGYRADTDTLTGFGQTFNETNRETVNYDGSYQVADGHSLQFGAEYLEENFINGSLNRSVELSGVYLQWLAQLGRLHLTTGMRRDDHSQFGQHDSYRLTASLPLDAAWRLRGVYGTGFKTPTLFELYDTTFGTGNPLLRPEESESMELGVEYSRHGYLAGLTLFEQTTNNLIRGVAPLFVNQNVNRAKSSGVELELGYTADSYRASGSFSWIDATEITANGTTRKRLRVPEYSGNLLVEWFLMRGSVWAELLYKSDRADVGGNVAEAYSRVDIGGRYSLSENFTLTANLENLLDETYEEVFSYGAPGRSGRVTLQWAF